MTDEEFELLARGAGCKPENTTTWLAVLGWMRWAYEQGYEFCKLGQEHQSDASVERAVILRCLRTSVKGLRDRANRLLADSTQNKPTADALRAQGVCLEETANLIEMGKHWR